MNLLMPWSPPNRPRVVAFTGGKCYCTTERAQWPVTAMGDAMMRAKGQSIQRAR